jgi:hypothetical protein
LKATIALYLIMSILALAILPGMQISARPSFFEQSNKNSDLKELEAMLSGGHPGIDYGLDMDSIYMPLQVNSTPSGQSYDPPFKELFLNNLNFGLFLRDFQSDFNLPQLNPNSTNLVLLSYPYPNFSINFSGKQETNRRLLAPILVEEPDI